MCDEKKNMKTWMIIIMITIIIETNDSSRIGTERLSFFIYLMAKEDEENMEKKREKCRLLFSVFNFRTVMDL